MVIRTHLQDLKDVTNNVHYENYRCRKLAGLGTDGKSRLSNKWVEWNDIYRRRAIQAVFLISLKVKACVPFRFVVCIYIILYSFLISFLLPLFYAPEYYHSDEPCFRFIFYVLLICYFSFWDLSLVCLFVNEFNWDWCIKISYSAPNDLYSPTFSSFLFFWKVWFCQRIAPWTLIPNQNPIHFEINLPVEERKQRH